MERYKTVHENEVFINPPKKDKTEGKVLTVKEVMEGRSSKYDFISFEKQTDWNDATKALMEAYGDNPKDFPYEETKTNLERLPFPELVGKLSEEYKHIPYTGEVWQPKEEKMYSEEEVLEILYKVGGWTMPDVKEWFEKVKK